MNCSLEYIPSRLHWNGESIFEKFHIGDLIFRRVKLGDENPFETISLCEVSNNLGTYQNDPISEPNDVLFNITSNDLSQIYEGHTVCTLEIKGLNQNNQYEKEFIEEKDGKVYTSIMRLEHDPISCMFPHCIFRIWLNDEIVTRTNYDLTLKNRKLNRIRTAIRQELATMIRRKAIDINFG